MPQIIIALSCHATYNRVSYIGGFMDKFAEAGIAWWNSITEQDRRYWLEMSKSASPVDAYKAWLVYRADLEAGVYGN